MQTYGLIFSPPFLQCRPKPVVYLHLNNASIQEWAA